MQQHIVDSVQNIDAAGLGACGLVELQRPMRMGRDLDERNTWQVGRWRVMVGLRCSSRGMDGKETVWVAVSPCFRIEIPPATSRVAVAFSFRCRSVPAMPICHRNGIVSNDSGQILEIASFSAAIWRGAPEKKGVNAITRLPLRNRMRSVMCHP